MAPDSVESTLPQIRLSAGDREPGNLLSPVGWEHERVINKCVVLGEGDRHSEVVDEHQFHADLYITDDQTVVRDLRVDVIAFVRNRLLLREKEPGELWLVPLHPLFQFAPVLVQKLNSQICR